MKLFPLTATIVGMIIILIGGLFFMFRVDSHITPSVIRERGVWVWDSPLQMSETKTLDMISNVYTYGFNTMYVTIDDYLSITRLSDTEEQRKRKNEYFEKLSFLITKAHEKGIAVDVEGGEADWVYPENRWKGFALIDFVQEYNQTHPESKIRGLQYDVEPYLLPNYDKNKETVLQQFVEFINESVVHMHPVDASFSVVIPHFYDRAQAWTPTVEHNGKTQYVFTHLLEILEKKPGSMVIIMAYRNFFEGDDGTHKLSEAEMNEAAQGYSTTKILVAQETGDVEPSYVTFFGKRKEDLWKSIDAIFETFSSSNNFGGVSIHYLDPFLELK